jgi:hypothetical protein
MLVWQLMVIIHFFGEQENKNPKRGLGFDVLSVEAIVLGEFPQRAVLRVGATSV